MNPASTANIPQQVLPHSKDQHSMYPNIKIIFNFVHFIILGNISFQPSQTLPGNWRSNRQENKCYPRPLPVTYKRSSGGSFKYARSYHHIYRNKSVENLNDHNINKSYENILPNSESNKPYMIMNTIYTRKCIQDLEFSSDHDYE